MYEAVLWFAVAYLTVKLNYGYHNSIQMVYISCKIWRGLWKKNWAFLWYQNLQNFEKKVEKKRLGSFNHLEYLPKKADHFWRGCEFGTQIIMSDTGSYQRTNVSPTFQNSDLKKNLRWQASFPPIAFWLVLCKVVSQFFHQNDLFI